MVRHLHFERFRSDIAEFDLLGVAYISAVDAHRIAANNRASGGIDCDYGRGRWLRVDVMEKVFVRWRGAAVLRHNGDMDVAPIRRRDYGKALNIDTGQADIVHRRRRHRSKQDSLRDTCGHGLDVHADAVTAS